MKNIYLFIRTDPVRYDEYDSEVVIAHSIEEAKALSNIGYHRALKISKIGTASRMEKPRCVCASFNAG